MKKNSQRLKMQKSIPRKNSGFTPIRNKRNSNIKNDNERKFLTGFTLVEMVAVVAVFSLVVVTTADLFITITIVARDTNLSRKVNQDAKYALETISQEARFAKRLDIDKNANIITTTSKNNVQVEFKLSSGTITMINLSSGAISNLTSSDTTKVTVFDIDDTEFSDGSNLIQPFFKLTIEVEPKQVNTEGGRITLRTLIAKSNYEEGVSRHFEMYKSIVSFWHFNEGSGTTVADSSGNGNHGFFPAAAAPNLLLNPSFESHTSWEPHNWSAFSSGSGSHMSTNWPVPPDGTLSLRVEFEEEPTYYGVRQSVSVTPGAQYRLSGWLRRSMDNGTWQCDVQGTGIDSPGIKLTSNANWTYKTETVTIPGGTSSVYIRCFGDSNPQGEVGNADALEFVQISDPAPTWVDGKKGSALSFDGIDDAVEVPDDPSLQFGSGDFTIESWFKRNGNPSDYEALVATYGAGDIWLALKSDGGIRAGYRDAAGNENDQSTGSGYCDNQWHHVAFVRDGDDNIVYVDGNYLGTNTVTGVGSTDSGNPYYLAKLTGTSWLLEGIIDEVEIHNKALSAGEILYRASH